MHKQKTRTYNTEGNYIQVYEPGSAMVYCQIYHISRNYTLSDTPAIMFMIFSTDIYEDIFTELSQQLNDPVTVFRLL